MRLPKRVKWSVTVGALKISVELGVQPHRVATQGYAWIETLDC